MTIWVDLCVCCRYSVRTYNWRYTEWFKFDGNTSKTDFNVTIANELYNHAGDDGSDMDKSELVYIYDQLLNSSSIYSFNYILISLFIIYIYNVFYIIINCECECRRMLCLIPTTRLSFGDISRF